MMMEEIGMEIDGIIEDIENGKMDLPQVAQALRGIIKCAEEEDKEPISKEEREALTKYLKEHGLETLI